MARGNSRAQSELQPIRGEKAAFRLGVRDALASLPGYAKGKVTVYEGEPYTPGRKSTTVTIKEAMKLPINLQRQILERYATDADLQVTRDGKPITKDQRDALEASAKVEAKSNADAYFQKHYMDEDFEVDDITGKSEPLTAYVKFGDNIFKYKYQVTNETSTEYREDRKPRSSTYTTRRIIEGSLEQA
jgi:hypothetical protein